MADFFVSPSGRDDAPGTESHPWSTAKLSAYQPKPGDTIRLRGGAVFPLSLTWWGVGDPKRPIELTSYGTGKATVASDALSGLRFGGAGGLRVRDVQFLGRGGDGNSGIEVTGNPDGGRASNFEFSNLEASGYAMGGLTVSTSTPISGVKISDSRFHGNAAGVHVSGGVVGDLSSRTVFDLRLERVDASDNNWAGSGHGPFGLSINGARGVKVLRGSCNRNGRLVSGAGHGGLLLRLCTDVEVYQSEFTDNADPERGSDGQGCVLDGVQDALVHHCLSRGNLNGGFEIMDESDGEWNQDVTFRHNVSLRDNTGLMAFLHGGSGIRFEFNQVLRSLYKSVDLSGSGPDDRLVLLGNTIEDPGFFALESEPEHLRKANLEGNLWPADRGVNVGGLGFFPTLAGALAAVSQRV